MGHGFKFKQESYEHDNYNSNHHFSGGHHHGPGPHMKICAPAAPTSSFPSSIVHGYSHHQDHGFSGQRFGQQLGHNTNKVNSFLGLGQTMHCPPNGNMGAWSGPNHGGTKLYQGSQFNNVMGGGMRNGGGGFYESSYEESSRSSHGGGGGGHPSAEWVSKGL